MKGITNSSLSVTNAATIKYVDTEIAKVKSWSGKALNFTTATTFSPAWNSKNIVTGDVAGTFIIVLPANSTVLTQAHEIIVYVKYASSPELTITCDNNTQKICYQNSLTLKAGVLYQIRIVPVYKDSTYTYMAIYEEEVSLS